MFTTPHPVPPGHLAAAPQCQAAGCYLDTALYRQNAGADQLQLLQAPLTSPASRSPASRCQGRPCRMLTLLASSTVMRFVGKLLGMHLWHAEPLLAQTVQCVCALPGGPPAPAHHILEAAGQRLLKVSCRRLQVQSVVRAPSMGRQRVLRKKNPLTNLSSMLRLNPYAQTLRRMEHNAQVRCAVHASCSGGTVGWQHVACMPAQPTSCAGAPTCWPC